MRKLSVVFLLQFACMTGLLAQSSGKSKPVIDTSVYGSWPSVSTALLPSIISNNGKYVICQVNNQSRGSKTLVIQSTDATWKKELPALSIPVYFTPDSRYAVYKNTGDSLVMLKLGQSVVEYIPKVQAYSLPETGNWWVYLPKTSGKELVAQDMKTGKHYTFSSINRYWLSNDGKTLFVHTVAGEIQRLIRIGLPGGAQHILWEGTNISNAVFDGKNNFSFTAPADGESNKKAIWYCTTGMNTAKPVVDDAFFGNNNDLQIDKLSFFSKNGKRLFITLLENKPFRPNSRSNRDALKLTIWSYTDVVLPSAQANKGIQAFSTLNAGYTAVVDLEKNKIIRLEQEAGELNQKQSDDLFLTKTLKPGADGFEQYWNNAIVKPLYLVSATDGSRKDISFLKNVQQLDVSPAGRYLLYWDPKQRSFCTYETATGAIKNITKDIVTDWINYKDDNVHTAPGIAPGWLAGDEWVLLYDQHDIWQVDPAGHRPPVNLTNGYGRKHGIIFRVAMQVNGWGGSNNLIVPAYGKLLLNAFNWKTKENGFYSINLEKRSEPALLTMGDYVYENKVATNLIGGMTPIKARDAERYIVRRMSATEFPNLFSTTDFKTFTPLTDLHPEKTFNWMTTELHSWPDGKGDTIQGILYKPENFDPTQKYPVIFYYYEQLSHRLNHYLEPKFGDGIFEIPWYVSNGYLVFCPDIHVTIGEPGESAVNAIVSAAKYLSQKQYVNADKMGITGFSYGGFETYYLVTHSNLFAAACAGAGVTDLISFYGQLQGNGGSKQTFIEQGQIRMSAMLWDSRDRYLKNSPVLQADKVTAPFLMYHNTIDDAVPFAQSLEFYLAMRRLGKRAWLLEYADGNHYMPGRSGVDLSVRMTQFFDHYLKNAPAPRWMLGRIPEKTTSMENGLELVKEKDKNGNYITPGEGLYSK